MPTTHPLAAEARTLHGAFDRDRPPVLEVDPGDTVVLSTLEAGWSAGPFAGGSYPDRPRHPSWRPEYGHALVGPIAVRGAGPGDVLAVQVVDVVPGAWGSTVSGFPSDLNTRFGLTRDRVQRWTLDAAAGRGVNQDGVQVPLRPFMGVLGMPPAEPGEHSTIPPRRHGGNLDCKELVAGSTLYLPVPVEGALLSVGDGHALQGDGEICGTAIECPMDRVELRLELGAEVPVSGPVARTPAGWLTMGLGDDLDAAALEALLGMFPLLEHLHGLDREDAVGLASLLVDLRVTQIVNQTVGVHALLPAGALPAVGRPGSGRAQP